MQLDLIFSQFNELDEIYTSKSTNKTINHGYSQWGKHVYPDL